MKMQKERGQYSAIKDLLYGGTGTGNPKGARWAHLARSGSQ